MMPKNPINVECSSELFLYGKLRDEVQAWCYENLTSEEWCGVYTFGSYHAPERWYVEFGNEQDALKFKLAWVG